MHLVREKGCVPSESSMSSFYPALGVHSVPWLPSLVLPGESYLDADVQQRMNGESW